jgi:hypothetical protein
VRSIGWTGESVSWGIASTSWNRKKTGLWPDIKADIHGFIDDLPGIAECWIELLDARYASLSRQNAINRPRLPNG